MAETVLVTGGTGYVAGWCIAELLRRGYRVRATVRDATKGTAVQIGVDPSDRLAFVVADLTADDGWDTAMAGCDYVLHVASPLGADGATDDALTIPARDGTLRVLGAATRAGVRRVVMTSAANAASPSSYTEEGTTGESLWTDLADPTLGSYRRSKTLAERAAWDFMADQDGPTTLTTILPGAVLGPILTAASLGSVQIVARMLGGRLPGSPRIGLEVVDVRDLADIHIRAMTSPAAAGQRFLATGEFVWMRQLAVVLHEGLGAAGSKVSTRQLPDLLVRLTAIFDRPLRSITVSLGRRHRHSTEKARRILGWEPRPAARTVLDCAQSLLAHGVA